MTSNERGGADPQVHASSDVARTAALVDSIDTRFEDSPYGWARYMASLGFRVHPLRPGSKVPQLRGWQHHATSDAAVLATWHDAYPSANWGVMTGGGVGVLDIDNKHGFDGDASWEQVATQLSDAAAMPRVATANNGAHAYFRYEGHLQERIAWREGIDLFGDSVRFVVAPGSLIGHDGDGGRYRLVHGDLSNLPTITSGDLALLNGPGGSSPGGRSNGHQGTADALPETDYLRQHGFRAGERDAGLYRLACRLWRQHWGAAALVHSIMREVWSRSDQSLDPFPWEWVEAKIQRAYEYIEPQERARRAFRWGRYDIEGGL